MFGLFKKCPNALDMFKQTLKAFIVAEGNKLVKNENIQNDELVKKIIEFRQKMVDLLQKSLDRDQTVELTVKTSFESFINENDKTARSLVMYLDENFKSHKESFDGLIARVVQHEYDHIEGILFTEHLSALKKRLIKGKLGNISKGKIHADYRMRFATAAKKRGMR